MPHVFALSAPQFGAAHPLARPPVFRRPHPGHYPHPHPARPRGPADVAPAWWNAPCACSPVMDAVIGTDGRVYRNACTAACHNVGVAQPAGGLGGVLGAAAAGTVGATTLAAGVAVGAVGVLAGYLLGGFIRRAVR